MAIKELQTRIALKYDSYANWTDDTKEGLGANLVLLKGELGICAIEDKAQGAQTAPTVLFKVGDGTTPFKSLKWASALAADVYSWAKASDVRLTGKTIEFVGGKDAEGKDIIVKSITINYATPEEVADAVKVVSDSLAGVDARVVALENKFTGDGSVQGQIDALDGRLDVIEGEGAGSIKKAEADAKAYTDEVVGIKANGDAAATGIRKEIADAEAAAKSYTDGKVSELSAEDLKLAGRLDKIEGSGEGSIAKAVADAVANLEDYADQAEADAIEAAKDYTDEREVEIEKAYKKYADDKDDARKTYVDGKVEALEAEDLRLAGLIGGNTTAIGNEETARINAVNAINTKIGTVAEGKDVVTMISDAQSAATSAANGYADEKVQALADGQVKTNKEDIAGLKAADTEIRGLITSEKERAEGIEADHLARIQKMEAFFEGAAEDSEGLNDALDKLVDIQNYLDGDGSAADGLIGQVSANTAAIDELEEEFAEGGRVAVAEGKISALEAADTAIGQRIDALVGDNGSIATGDAATLSAAKTYAEEQAAAAKTHAEQKASAAQTAATNAAAEALAAAVSTLNAKDSEIEGKVTALQTLTGADGTIQKAIKEAKDQADKGVEDAGKAQAAADKAQGEVDALEGVVATLRGEYDVTKALATTNEAAIAALDTRVGTAEGNITTLQGIVNSGEGKTIRDDVTALQTLTGANGAIRQEIAAAKKAGDDAAAAVDALAKGQVATNKSDIAGLDGRVAAIETDYVKASDLVGDFYIFNCGSATKVTHEAPKAE